MNFKLYIQMRLKFISDASSIESVKEYEKGKCFVTCCGMCTGN